MPGRRLQRYASARGELLQRIVAALEADRRVLGAWLSGSVGRGDGDEWADYDLHVAIDDDGLDAFLRERRALYEGLGVVALVQDRIPGQASVADRFHLVNFVSPDGPIEVDWSFLPASQARKPLAHVLLFERRPFVVMEQAVLSFQERREAALEWAMFFWSMAPIAVKFCGRGETARAVRQIDLLSRALISLWRLVEEKDGIDPWAPDLNRPLEAIYERRLPRLGRTISPRHALEVVGRLCDEAENLRPTLKELDADAGASIAGQTRALIATAEVEIRTSRFRPRQYR